MIRRLVVVLSGVLLSLIFVLGGCSEGPKIIRIGFNIPLTGDLLQVGDGSRRAAEMLREEINTSGGLTVGGEKYPLEFVYEDNASTPESAKEATLKLVNDSKVLAFIGPQASKQAVPAGGVADQYRTVMISAWSTNPKTTEGRPWVFRACFLDPFQGPVIAKFATEEFDAKTAAVLYDSTNEYPKGLAEFFRKAFEKMHGMGSVIAFEEFTTKARNYTTQLQRIVSSEADFLFVPQYYDEVAGIVKQAHAMGWKNPILGGDAWGSAELMKSCGDDCKGLFFSTHYAAAGARGITKEFIDRYEARYDEIPDDVAALTWDAARLILQAIQNTGAITDNRDKDRENLKNQLAQIREFQGITGKMSFTPEGNPVKCAVIVKINDDGVFEFYKTACP